MSALGITGLVAMIVSQTATFLRIEPFYSWNTPICWTGFILFADDVVWHARGRSWLRSSPREFIALAALSIPLWLVFEGYNQLIDNWHYTGLPIHLVARYAGFAWAFATIWPAIFEAAELVAVVRASRVGDRPAPSERPAHPARPAALALLAVTGGAMLLWPFFASPAVAPYLAAPVWLGFIFLLDPLNDRAGGDSLLADWRHGRTDRLINLAAAGLLCGALWEFWNYWAGAKWHYTVPIMENVKIFEMPLPGYLGFPPFALECFAMYVSARLVYAALTRRRRAAELAHRIAL
jgi:hypothetical protein